MPLSTCIVLESILGAGALCQAELLLPAKLAEIKLVLGEKKKKKQSSSCSAENMLFVHFSNVFLSQQDRIDFGLE